MPTWGPTEQAKLMLVRADVVTKLDRTAARFEKATGQKLFVIRGWVTSDEQARVYADSLTAGYRAAPADKSYHPLGAAIDVGIVGRVRDAATDQKDPLYRQLADIAESEELDAGFYFKTAATDPDPYHLQAKESLADAKAKWAALTKERLQRSAFVGAIAVVAIGLAIAGLRYFTNRRKRS